MDNHTYLFIALILALTNIFTFWTNVSQADQLSDQSYEIYELQRQVTDLEGER